MGVTQWQHRRISCGLHSPSDTSIRHANFYAIVAHQYSLPPRFAAHCGGGTCRHASRLPSSSQRKNLFIRLIRPPAERVGLARWVLMQPSSCLHAGRSAHGLGLQASTHWPRLSQYLQNHLVQKPSSRGQF